MKKLLLASSILLFCLTSICQINTGGSPLGLNKKNLPDNIPLIELEKINTQLLLEEDMLLNETGNYPFRFGADISVSYTLNNSGLWHPLVDGSRLWRLKIKSQDAYSLNFIMKNFYLPEGARLFLYNETGQYSGAFTSLNNTEEKEFATAPLSGDMITFELYEPFAVKGQSSMEISHVIHAYRNIFCLKSPDDKSGSCNININCPEGANWQNEKRAVALILTANNSSICTGALVNNVRQDATPYFLTANHCLVGANSNTWIFMFNYESASCVGSTGPTNHAVQGSVLRAKNSPSDFALLELTTPPPSSFNVYFAGWSNLDVVADSCVGIHHPSGDVKKIALDYDTVESSGYSGAGNDHWRILSWDLGTTEGGSSGSPLFNKDKKVIGQLHGGTASCTNPTGYDVYGKFAYSWNTGSTADKRLKDWLDPDDTGVTELQGTDFNTPLYDYDAMLSHINEPTGSDLCRLEISPVINVRNNGNIALTSLKVSYILNAGATQFINWSGHLNYQEFTDINLPLINLTEGVHELKIFLSDVNDTTDQNPLNDTLIVVFNAFVGNEVTLELTTDNYPEETSWKLLDTLGNVLYVNAALSGETSYTELFCLHNGCYNFVILDSYGDGMAGGGWWNPSPPGTYTIIFNGNILGSGSGNFGFSDTIYFCVASAGIFDKVTEMPFSIYPNPSIGEFWINYIGKNKTIAEINIYDISGRLIFNEMFTPTEKTKIITNLKNGAYIISINFQNNKQSLYKAKLLIIN